MKDWGRGRVVLEERKDSVIKGRMGQPSDKQVKGIKKKNGLKKKMYLKKGKNACVSTEDPDHQGTLHARITTAIHRNVKKRINSEKIFRRGEKSNIRGNQKTFERTKKVLAKN